MSVAPPTGDPGSGFRATRGFCLAQFKAARGEQGFVEKPALEADPAVGILVGLFDAADRNGDGKLTNSAGATGEKAVWGHIADWCDYSGTIDGKKAGIAVFADPRNASPAAWHARGYGLMAANPFGRDKSGFPAVKGKTDLVKIEKGKELKLKYAVYAHSGDAKAGKVAEAYEVFKK